MNTLALVAFWVCFSVCFYIYFGYPLLLSVLSVIKPRAVQEADVFPHATFIIPAYNEETVIGEKIRNTLSVDYPRDRIDVLVVSNGSTDRTVEIARGAGDARVGTIEMTAAGKIQALNEGARCAGSDILVFSDADFLLDRESMKAIARKFADPTVGGVCGARGIGTAPFTNAIGDGEGAYGRWDRWQKIRESRIGSVFAADGLLYAIRRELYVPPSDPAQADDIAISAAVPLQGFRLLYDPSAVAWENTAVRTHDEFRRKIRVTQHSVRALLNLRHRLFTSGFYSIELLSHKLVRHCIPFFLIGLFVANIPLIPISKFYAIAFAGQVAIYALAIAGALLRDTRAGRSRLLYIPYYFCFVNAAALLGILQMFRGQRVSAWSTRTQSS
jgi:cellulose synthase/poly-beta-1,6-N-acetylglucosamine synthase-like glycosyltransferase